jgi:hypothetical protein
MLKLNAHATEPRWIDLLPGVRVQVRPLEVVDHLRARSDAAQVFRDHPQEVDEARDPAVDALASVALTKSFARACIVAWEGIGDADGEPIEPTPETIDRLLEVFPAFDAFDRLVMGPALSGAAAPPSANDH